MTDSFFPASKVLCVLTGASRGFGRTIATRFARLPVTRLHFILTARSEADLLSLKHLLEEGSPSVTADVVVGSLGEKETLDRMHEQMVTCSGTEAWDQVLMVHNAGSLHDPSLLLQQLDRQSFDDLNQYFALNVTSLICLTSSFLTVFAGVGKKLLVNISSLASVQAMRGLAVYGSGKAARDSLIRSIAAENLDVRCISYAPGPMDTDMAQTLRTDSYLKEFFENSENILKPETSVEKLIHILTKNEFQNGAHVDFYEDMESE